MKNTFQFLSTLLLAQISFATDGLSTGCFQMAAYVPTNVPSVNGSEPLMIPSRGSMCITEKNMKSVDEQYSKGEIKVEISVDHKIRATYNFGFAAMDGALGTIYTTYGKTAADVTAIQTPENKYKVLTFIMRNDHIKKGELAGRVEIDGETIYLIQK